MELSTSELLLCAHFVPAATSAPPPCGSHFEYFVHLPEGWGVLKAGGFKGEPNRGCLDLCRFLELVRVIEAGRNSGGSPARRGVHGGVPSEAASNSPVSDL